MQLYLEIGFIITYQYLLWAANSSLFFEFFELAIQSGVWDMDYRCAVSCLVFQHLVFRGRK